MRKLNKQDLPHALLLSLATLVAFTTQVQLAAADPTTDAENAFRTQANAICKQEGAAIKAIPEPKKNSPLASSLKYFSQILKTITPYEAQLRQLPLDQASEQFKSGVQQYLGQSDMQVANIKALVKAIKNHDVAAIKKAFKQAKTLEKAASQTAKQLGLTECA